MKMRDKKRALAALLAPAPVPPELAPVVDALTQIRRARVAMLRNPQALAEIKGQIKLMGKGPAGVLRRMLAEDLKLMRVLDRQERRRASAR